MRQYPTTAKQLAIFDDNIATGGIDVA
jgi:hypothetical protein